jgi:hypothetical protein
MPFLLPFDSRDGFVNNKNDTGTVAVKAKFCNTNFEDDFPLLLFLVISNGYFSVEELKSDNQFTK